MFMFMLFWGLTNIYYTKRCKLMIKTKLPLLTYMHVTSNLTSNTVKSTFSFLINTYTLTCVCM